MPEVSTSSRWSACVYVLFIVTLTIFQLFFPTTMFNTFAGVFLPKSVARQAILPGVPTH